MKVMDQSTMKNTTESIGYRLESEVFKMEVVVKGYDEGSLNVVTILHTDRPSPYILNIMYLLLGYLSVVGR